METEYHFEYGKTADYGKSTPVQSAGDGISDVQVSADISGLIRATTYHYRLVASNDDGTAYGSDANFTTKGCVQVRTC